MTHHRPTVKSPSDAFVFSDRLEDWLPRVHEKRARELACKHKSLRNVKAKRNHTKDLNSLM